MTKISLMRHAVRLWQVPHVPREINRANARKWLAAVERLGDKWLLSKPVRREHEQINQES
jgi:hypothetical protein